MMALEYSMKTGGVRWSKQAVLIESRLVLDSVLASPQIFLSRSLMTPL